MPFPRIDFNLTDEQAEVLVPFTKEIAIDNKKNVIAELFIIPNDYRFKEVRVRLLDAIAARSIQERHRSAQEDYDVRQDKARRLRDLQNALRAQSISATVSDEVVIVQSNGHRYELREVE